jgi:hypothetical protein
MRTRSSCRESISVFSGGVDDAPDLQAMMVRFRSLAGGLDESGPADGRGGDGCASEFWYFRVGVS